MKSANEMKKFSDEQRIVNENSLAMKLQTNIEQRMNYRASIGLTNVDLNLEHEEETAAVFRNFVQDKFLEEGYMIKEDCPGHFTICWG